MGQSESSLTFAEVTGEKAPSVFDVLDAKDAKFL